MLCGRGACWLVAFSEAERPPLTCGRFFAAPFTALFTRKLPFRVGFGDSGVCKVRSERTSVLSERTSYVSDAPWRFCRLSLALDSSSSALLFSAAMFSLKAFAASLNTSDISAWRSCLVSRSLFQRLTLALSRKSTVGCTLCTVKLSWLSTVARSPVNGSKVVLGVDFP